MNNCFRKKISTRLLKRKPNQIMLLNYMQLLRKTLLVLVILPPFFLVLFSFLFTLIYKNKAAMKELIKKCSDFKPGIRLIINLCLNEKNVNNLKLVIVFRFRKKCIIWVRVKILNSILIENATEMDTNYTMHITMKSNTLKYFTTGLLALQLS